MRKPINTVQIENDVSLVLKICTYVCTKMSSRALSSAMDSDVGSIIVICDLVQLQLHNCD